MIYLFWFLQAVIEESLSSVPLPLEKKKSMQGKIQLKNLTK